MGGGALVACVSHGEQYPTYGHSADSDAATKFDIRSRFLVYQNRVEHEAYFFVGKRSDTLRLEEGCWRLLRREIDLDQNVLLAKNLTIFL